MVKPLLASIAPNFGQQAGESGSAVTLAISLDDHYYGNPGVDCGNAEVTAQSRHLATLLTIEGVVDEANVEPLTERGNRFVLPDTGFVLDLSGVTACSADAVGLVRRIDDACRALGIDWALVASRAVMERLTTSDAAYPFAASVPDALHRFADQMRDRRRLLLPFLVKKR